MGLDPCGLHINNIAFQMPCPAFGHLAPAGIAGT